MDSSTVRVLLVEDDPDDYYLTNEMLSEALGSTIELDWAKDFESALKAIANCDHDAYLLDYRLGKRNGIELLSSAIKLGCKGPLIVLTGAADRELALQALDVGAADYLVKGEFDAAALERAIRFSIQQSRQAEELEQKVNERTAELEKANAELKSSEEFSRTVLESSPDCVKVLDTDGRLLSLNTGGMCQLEIDDFDDFCGKPWKTLWPLEGGKRIELSVATAKGGSTDRFQAFSPTAKGIPKWWDVMVAPVRDAEGKVVRLISVSRDITDTKLEEMRAVMLARLGEIIRTHSEPDALLYAVSVAVGVHFGVRRCFFNEIDLEKDLGTVRRDYSRRAKSYAGQHKLSDFSAITNAEMQEGKTVINSDSKLDPRTTQYYQKTYEPNGDRAFVAVPLLRGGRWVASLRISVDKPREWTGDEVKLLEGIGERSWLAVEKLRSEAALRDSEERFATAFNASPLAVTITSLTTGKIVEVNDTFVKMTGYGHAEAVGRTTDELGIWKTPEDRDAELAALQNEGSIRDREYIFRMRDGSEITGMLSAEMLDIGGEPCALTVIQDITERKRSADILAEQKRLLEALTESVLDGILIVAPDGQMLHYNQQFLDIWNFPPEVVELRSDAAALEWAARQTTDPAAFRERVDHIYSQPDIQFREEMTMNDGRVFERFGAPVHYGKTRLGWVWTFRDITERKRWEDLISESEQRMRVAMNAANMYSWEIDVVAGTTVISPGAAQVLGFERPSDVTDVAMQIGSLIHPDDRSRISESVKRASVNGELHEEMRFVAPSTGTVVWAETQGTVLRDADGKPVKLIGVTQNISERKLAQEELRLAEARRRLALDSAELGSWHLDIASMQYEIDERFRTIWGIPADQSYEQALTCIHPDDQALVDEAVAAAIREDDPAPYDIEYRVVHPNASIHWIHAKGRLNLHGPEPHEQPVSLDGTIADITEQKLREEALRESEEKYRTLFESIDEGFCLLELLFNESGEAYNYVFLEANAAFERQSGLVGAVGRSILDFVPGIEPQWAKVYAQVAKTGEPVRFDADVASMARIFDIYAFSGGGNKVAVVFNDITERKRSEANLSFLADVSRELVALTNIGDTMDALGAKIGAYFGATRVAFFEFNEAADEAVCEYAWHAKADDISLVGNFRTADFYTDADEFISTLRAGEAFVLGDGTADERVVPESLTALDILSFIVVPANRDTRLPLSVLALNNNKARDWRDDEIELLRELTTRIWTRLERARAEDERAASEAKYRTLFNSTDQGFAIVEVVQDAHGTVIDCRYLEVNRAYDRQIGFGNVEGKLISEVLPQLESYWMDQFDRVIRTGEPIRFENYNVDTGKWYQANYTRVGGAGSRLVGIVFDEITGRKRHEANLAFLAEVSADLVSLTNIDATMDTLADKIGKHFSAAGVVFSEVNEDGETVTIKHDWHRADFFEIVGTHTIKAYFSPEFEALHRAGGLAIVNDTSKDERVDAESYAALGIGAFVGVPLIRQGSWQFYFAVLSPCARDWRGDETELMRELITRIWTRLERARAEDAVRESEDRLRTMADSIPQLAWMAEPDGSIFWYNKRWYEYTGTTFEQMEGWGWQSVHDPEILPEVLAGWTRSIETSEPFEMEFPIRGVDGVFRWFLTRVNPLHDSDGNLVRWFGTNTDITERRVAEEVLLRNMDELSRFNRAMVGRELRMIELKKEVNEFCRVTGEEKRYNLEFEESGKDEDIR